MEGRRGSGRGTRARGACRRVRLRPPAGASLRCRRGGDCTGQASHQRRALSRGEGPGQSHQVRRTVDDDRLSVRQGRLPQRRRDRGHRRHHPGPVLPGPGAWRGRRRRRRSWHQSLTHMNMVMGDDDIPDDTGVCVELQIPQTSKRIDFVLTGQDAAGPDHAVIVELKQWETAERTPMDGVVRTFVGRCRAVRQPSLVPGVVLRGAPAGLQRRRLRGRDRAPALRLPAQLPPGRRPRSRVLSTAHGARSRLPETGRPQAAGLHQAVREVRRPGQDHLPDRARADPAVEDAGGQPGGAAAGQSRVRDDRRPEDRLRDGAPTRPSAARDGKKRVLIVNGGPGTGKSVVAVNLLVELTRREQLSLYVTKNAAPRAVFESKLTGVMTKTRYSNLFQGSGGFMTSDRNSFDVPGGGRGPPAERVLRPLQEPGREPDQGAHARRRRPRSSSWTRTSGSPSGTSAPGRRSSAGPSTSGRRWRSWSSSPSSGATDRTATSPGWTTRCRSAPPRTPTWVDFDYDFQVFSSPSELRDFIVARNEENQRSRLVAGYCWNWASKKDPEAHDIVFPEHDFAMRWNLKEDGSLWIMKPESINEIGCIHTCQGLELDHVGVIMGEDLVVRDGRVVTQPEKRARLRQHHPRLQEAPEGRSRDGARADARRDHAQHVPDADDPGDEGVLGVLRGRGDGGVLQGVGGEVGGRRQAGKGPWPADKRERPHK